MSDSGVLCKIHEGTYILRNGRKYPFLPPTVHLLPSPHHVSIVPAIQTSFAPSSPAPPNSTSSGIGLLCRVCLWAAWVKKLMHLEKEESAPILWLDRWESVHRRPVLRLIPEAVWKAAADPLALASLSYSTIPKNGALNFLRRGSVFS